MITIAHYISSSSRPVVVDANSVVTLPAFLADERERGTSTSASNSGTTTVSILSRQLSEAATRAETHAGGKSADLLDPITGDNYFASKSQHDIEIPTTQDPELLVRARQATGFVNGSDSNPFKNLSRDQLHLIAHDEGGSFTINERRAAWETMQPAELLDDSSPKPVSVNGRDIMISRLFGNSEPPVALAPATFYNITQNRNEFLSSDDRALIADMYAYAQAEGADLHYVDQLVMSLSTFRYYSDGRQLSGNNGYNAEGYRVTYDVKPADTVIAAGILNGSALASTRIDQDFLRYILSSDHRAFSNVGGIPFLERMVKKFSDEGANQPPLGSEFATYKKVRYEDHIVQTTYKHIRLPPSKVLAGKVDGVWTLTELGKSEGYTLDKLTGRLSKPTAPTEAPSLLTPAPSTSKRTFLDALRETPDQPATRWIWPGHLFKLMKNYKP